MHFIGKPLLCVPVMWVVGYAPAHAQLGYAPKKYADAKNAIEVKDSIAGPFNVAFGYGETREWVNKSDPYTQENSSVWLTFIAKRDTALVFDIVPIDTLQDFDFAVFKYHSKSTLDSLNLGLGKPMRGLYTYCLARKASTGLSEYSVITEILCNAIGPPYAASIPMKKGERYYIMVNFNLNDSYHKRYDIPKGFNIYFYNFWPPKQAVVLKNVFFETNKATLLKNSFPELDKLAERLKKNTAMNIEIRGHTDNVGNAADNKLLSQNRAKAVRDYLVSKGVPESRVSHKGFGSTQPVSGNDTEEGRQKNRRVEFAVVGK